MYKRTTILSARLLSTCMASLFMIPSCSSNEPQYPEINNKDNNKEKKTILTEADPTIFRDTDGTYYLYGTGAQSDKGFYVYQSKDLKEWSGPVGKENGFCLTSNTSFGTTGFWAPQVAKRGDTYYMFYTANEQIAVATAPSPLGPFSQPNKQMIQAPCKTIDPYVLFDNDGKVYLYHVRLQNGNRIYVAEMTDDLSSIKEETAKECISASLPWEDTEQVACKVTEGPTVLHIGDTYYMFYSANDFRNIDYAVGIATADNPYGPWTKQNAPIISRTNIGYYGTGHGDAFLDDAGKWKYVFHTHQSFTEVAPRKTALVGLNFKNGSFTIEENTFTYLYKK